MRQGAYRPRALAVLVGFLLLCVQAVPVQARVFRWANDGDVSVLDPYGRNETFLLSFLSNIYEPLVRRTPDMGLEPALATKWEQISPTVWRFTLRQGVRFHDGSPFTADDVVFSLGRAKTGGSAMKSQLASIKSVRKIDASTIHLITDGVDPILPDSLVSFLIMSKSWAIANKAVHTADLPRGESNYASDHTNGTGPFRLHTRLRDDRTQLTVNPDWWDKPHHNLTEVHFQVIQDPAQRVAALRDGSVDMLYAVPPQDIARLARDSWLSLHQRPELRTIFLGMDQSRPELLESSVKGRNPFQDVRVRRAVAMAVDNQAIVDGVMNGQAAATGLMISPAVRGFNPALNTRLAPYDPVGARALLREAGYPDGFTLGMDCPTDRYVNDQQICETVVKMLGAIGITVQLNAQPRSKFFAKVNAPNYQTSFFLLGWTAVTVDAHDALFNLAHCREDGAGSFGAAGHNNLGGYCNRELDRLISQIQVETESSKRQTMIDLAMTIIRTDIAYIPLHQQMTVWAARRGIELSQRPDNYFQLSRVRMN